MPKPLDPKCQLCSKLPTAQAKVLHGTAGDGCWNPKVCHNRRSFYRHRSQNNSAEIDAIAIEPPATYFAVLYLYKESGDKPLHALGAELWLGQQPICRLEPIHCFGLTAGKIRAYTDQVLQAFAKQYSVSLVLAMLDEVTTLEDVRNLASDEDVQKWQSAIANYLINVKDEISLVKLQRVLQMPMVEVWLGLLLGGFTLEQRGDFYHNQNVWVKSSPITNTNPI